MLGIARGALCCPQTVLCVPLQIDPFLPCSGSPGPAEDSAQHPDTPGTLVGIEATKDPELGHSRLPVWPDRLSAWPQSTPGSPGPAALYAQLSCPGPVTRPTEVPTSEVLAWVGGQGGLGRRTSVCGAGPVSPQSEPDPLQAFRAAWPGGLILPLGTAGMGCGWHLLWASPAPRCPGLGWALCQVPGTSMGRKGGGAWHVSSPQ